jgi:hypothetical protein
MREDAAEPHIWWGVSVENKKHGLTRIKEPAAVPFLSVELLLEDIRAVARRDGVLFHPKVQLCMHNSHGTIFQAGVLRLHP